MTTARHAANPGKTFESHAEFYRDSEYSAFPQEHRSGGSFGVAMMKTDQQPIDFIDAPVPELVFCRGDNAGHEILLDVGDGPAISSHECGSLTVYPAATASRTRVLEPHQITQLALPLKKVPQDIQDLGVVDRNATTFSSYVARTR